MISEEEKKGVGNKKREFIPGFNDCSQGIDTIPHVGVATDNIYVWE